MSKQVIEEDLTPPLSAPNSAQERSRRWFYALCISALLYGVCLLATTVPLYRNPVYNLPSSFWLSNEIMRLGGRLHLSDNLGFVTNYSVSAHITNFVEFMFAILALFVIYGGASFFVARCKSETKAVISLIFLVTCIAGFIYAFTPGTLSEDVYLYANYGRTLVVHHANPYFAPPAAFPQDPSYRFVWWQQIVSVYGPIWVLVSGLLASISGTTQSGYFLAFRLFALAIHLINALLVMKSLKVMGKTPRTIAVGTVLYAWNPLILFESCIGGHNDILMSMFLLAGIYLGARTEKQGSRHIYSYIPALIACSLAVLVKLTILPVVILFIIMLLCKQNRPAHFVYLKNWRALLQQAGVASGVCIGVACICYGPFWLGHSLQAIMYSFSSQPPTTHAFNSLLFALQLWNTDHALPKMLTWLLSNQTWNIIAGLALVAAIVAGAIRLWQQATMQNVVLTTLGVVGVFLITTNWFLPWYVTMLVSLAILCIPAGGDRMKRALVVFALTLSATAFLAYYYNFVGTYYIHFQPVHNERLTIAYIVQFSVPLLAFLLALAWPVSTKKNRVVE